MRFRINSCRTGHLVDFAEGPTAVDAAQALADRRGLDKIAVKAYGTADEGDFADWEVAPIKPKVCLWDEHIP